VPTGSEENTLCVIGDPDQSIYRFRGSDCIYFRKFLNDYPDSTVLHLTRNYRSTKTILSASFQVINQDEENRIRTYSDIDGDRTISVIDAKNEDAEAESIARTIERLIGGTGYHSIDTGRVSPASLSHGWGYSDFAVLTRTSDQLRTIAGALNNVGVPFQLNDRNQVLKPREVVWVFSLLKILFQRGSYGDFQNVVEFLAPKMNRRVRDTFTNWCSKNRLSLKEGFAAAVRFPIPGLNRNQQLELSALIGRIAAMEAQASKLKGLDRLTHLIKHPSLAERVAEEKTSEALNRLIEMVADSASDGEAVFNRLALCTDTDLYRPRAEKTALMTLHAAKGLEFAVVFIAGCEDGLIPFRRSMECDGTEGDEAAQAEERRLFYVAMTRAKERLYLTWTKRRKVFGKTLNREKSPFVSLIENRLLQDESACSGNKKRKPDQLQLF
jgi:superfamily I DNA/RNA helicase